MITPDNTCANNKVLHSSAYYLEALEAARKRVSEYRECQKQINEALRLLGQTEKDVGQVNNKLDSLVKNMNQGVKVIKRISVKIGYLNNEKEGSVSSDIYLKVVEEKLELEREHYRVLLYNEESNVETLENNYNDAFQREKIEEFNKQ